MRLRVAFLWHMHQPSYWDSRLGKYRYPWAFLHGARHYHMMARLAELHPAMRLTFNITPVLMEQLEHYSQEVFRDVLLEPVLKPAADLTEEEMRRVLEHVFKIHAPTMIDPFPRYRELKGLLGGTQARAKLRRVKPQELRDLQTLYLLTWCGGPLREEDPVRSLLLKERDYTEEDKRGAFRAMQEAVRDTLGLYRQIQDRGQAEISTTPYFHPILPLLINADVAREARPGVDLEGIDFRYPQDAGWQVQAAIRAYQERFGGRPAGMWPAEGGVSDEALALFAENGVGWAATDEALLYRSMGRGLSPAERHRPFRVGGRILVYFRDRELSDRIGFVYSGWNPVQAADDVVGRLLGIREQMGPAADTGCVTIILDGENPWEYYPDGGTRFLSRLYTEIPRSEALEPVCMRDLLEAAGAGTLGRLSPGSWIDGNFDTWIGSPKKNHAWKILGAARGKLAREAPKVEVPREFYRAEGSDWFWWLGPGHDTPYEDSYENLFRLSLQEGLGRAGLEAPPILHTSAPVFSSMNFQPPMHLFTPRIDGQWGSYYDWVAAGYYRASDGSFHRANKRLTFLRFGFDTSNLYVRLEGDFQELRRAGAARVVIDIQKPRPVRFVFQDGTLEVSMNGSAGGQRWAARGAFGAVVELAVPLSELGTRPGDVVELAAELYQAGELVERLPHFGYMHLEVPAPEYGLENWSV